MASVSRGSQDENTNIIEVNLLMKIQTAGKSWDKAPEELVKLYQLLTSTGYEVSWSPTKLGINLLTPNKIRGIVLKRMLMKLYPFETFWMTETLDETLHKCLFVCQQLGIEVKRHVIWGQCSVEVSYPFWIEILKQVPPASKTKSEEDMEHEAKTKVIAAVIASRGTDWDRKIARNFEEKLGTNRLLPLLKNKIGNTHQENTKKPKARSSFQMSNSNWRVSFQSVFQESRPDQPIPTPTTSSLAAALKQESLEMIQMLRHLEKYFSDDSVLQIDKAFEYGLKVCELIEEFEGYMNANNRGAFRDIDALTNHTDKVIKAMSKLTTAYHDFFMEFQKYLGSGRGDELNLTRFLIPAELLEKNN